MKGQPTTVLIPLAAQSDEGAVCEIVGQDLMPTSAVSGFDPTIAKLVDVELQGAGQVALDTFRQLDVQKQDDRLRLTRPISAATELLCVNTTEIVGLSARNTRSAELGLALAQLMHARKSRCRLAIATGALGRRGDGGFPVKPVDRISQKLQAVRDWLSSRSREVRGHTIPFFLPLELEDGQLLEQVFADELKQLCADATALGATLNIIPISKLEDAIPHLQLAPNHLGRRENTARAALAFATVLISLVALFIAWTMQAPTLAFDTLPWAFGEDPQSPVAVQMDRNVAEAVPVAKCYGDDQRLQVRVGNFLATRVKIGGESWLDRFAGLHNVALFVLGEVSQPFVFPADALPEPDRLRRTELGHLGFGAAIPIAAPEEAMKLVVIARRFWSLDETELQNQLLEIHKSTEAGELRLSTMTAHLASGAEAYLDYNFRSVLDECEGAGQ